MLIIGTIQTLIEIGEINNCEIFNFSSLNEKFPRLKLFPPNNLGAKDEFDFDVKYAQYIIMNENIFFDMMRIIYSLYIGKDVYLLIDNSEQMEMYNESLLKFIQQRYGYNCTIINTLEDFLESESGGFSPLGFSNVTNDNNRMAFILEKNRISNGGNPYIDL